MEEVSLHVEAGDGGGPISVLTISGLVSALLNKKELDCCMTHSQLECYYILSIGLINLFHGI